MPLPALSAAAGGCCCWRGRTQADCGWRKLHIDQLLLLVGHRILHAWQCSCNLAEQRLRTTQHTCRRDTHISIGRSQRSPAYSHATGVHCQQLPHALASAWRAHSTTRSPSRAASLCIAVHCNPECLPAAHIQHDHRNAARTGLC